MAIGIGKATLHIGARNSGGWPFAARAQQSKMRRIGVLMSTAETEETVSLAAFNEELAKPGWTTGQNVTIDLRWGSADAKQMTAKARELVSLAAPTSTRHHARACAF